MYCKKCGELLPDRTKFCTNCGAPQQEDPRRDETVLNPAHTRSEDCVHEGHVVGASPKIGFVQAIILFFTRFKDFKGRSRRSEYWWAALATGLISALLAEIAPDISWMWSLLIFIPTFSLSVRRLHDIGKSGWWYLINFIPLIGQVIYFIFMCRDSTEDNRWGVNPKA